MGKEVFKMAKRKTSTTPGKKGVKHAITKKQIVKNNENSKAKKNSVIKALGMQVLSSVKSKIIASSPPVVGMEVQVKWADNTNYPATVVKIVDGDCLVHYKGWNKKHDEWIPLPVSPRRSSKRTAFTELNVNQKNNIGKLNEIKSIKKGIEASEGIVESDKSEKDSDEDDPEMVGLCEYEKIRLRNIRERQALFEELKISEAKSDLSQMFTPTQIKQGPSKRGLASTKKEKEILPPRKSSRLSGGKVPEIQRYVAQKVDLKWFKSKLKNGKISGKSLNLVQKSHKLNKYEPLLSTPVV